MSLHTSDERSISKQGDLSRDQIIDDLRDCDRFKDTFELRRDLGVGTDGQVRKWKHRSSGKTIAMKVPADDKEETHLRIMTEIRNLEIIGNHKHILSMLAYIPDFPCLGPSIFFPVCDLGDLGMYVERWYRYQVKNNRPEQVSELTVWKLFRDMVLALDHLHNKLGTCYVHQDLKPCNILVQTPAGYTGGRCPPVEPTFLICDFARMTPCPEYYLEEGNPWFGTPEFAPPLWEQRESIHPSGDIWTLGTTIQCFSLNILPSKSRQSFILEKEMKGEPCPRFEESTKWSEKAWRQKIPTVYRPLNVSREELVQNHDAHELAHTYQPFSENLNCWYEKLFETERHLRITSAELVRDFIPLADVQMAKLRMEQQPGTGNKMSECTSDDTI